MDIAHEWPQFGRALNVHQQQLDIIKAKLSSAPRQCLSQVVQEFLKNYDWQTHGHPSWRLVVIATAHRAGGNNTSLALRIAKDHPIKSESFEVKLPHQESGDSALGSEGRPSISSPMSPQSPLSPFTPRKLPPGEMFSSDEVAKIAEELATEFNDMVTCAEKALQDSQAKPRAIVNILRRHDAHFSYVPREFFSSLRQAPDVTELFFMLDDYWDPLNYFLLERLVLLPATRGLFADHLRYIYDGLKERMQKYKENMEYFRKHTDVEVYCSSVLLHKRNPQIPAGFKELVETRDLKTLEDVEKFRQEVAYEHKLFDCLVFLKKIICGSVVLTFWIPAGATPSGLPVTEAFGDDSEGSSVDPIIITDDRVQVEWFPTEDQPPPQEKPKEGTKKAVVKKESGVVSAITAMTKLVVPKYMFDPIVLMRAVSNEDKAEVELLLSKGADPNASPPMVASKAVKFVYKTLIDKPRRNVMKHFKTPLTAAAEHGTLEKVKELIARGEDVNRRTESTPLKEACNRGELEIARALLEAGADPNMVTDNWTPLMEASRVGNREMIQLLVEFEAECNTTNSDNWTALMAASRNGHTQAVEELLQSKAEPNQQDHVGWSALLTAVFRHHEEISLKLAEAGANPHLQNLMCTSALRLAIDSEQDGVIDAFLERHPDVKAGLRGDPQLNSTDKYRETDLLFACKKKNHRVVKLLLCKGADPDCANIFGEYPLLRAVKDGNIEMVEELLRVGANPNMTTDEGTPLSVAAKCGEVEIVKLLLKEKADPNKADFIDQLPLYHARRLQNEKLIELLEDKTNPALEHELPGRVAHYYSRLTKRTTSFFKTLGLSSEPSK